VEVSSTPVVRQGRTRKPALREQIASQPASRPTQRDGNAELVSYGKSTIDFNVEKSVEASNLLGEASKDTGEKASEVEAFSFFRVAPQSGSESLVEAPDQSETLLLESKEEDSFPEEVQEPALLDVGDDTSTQQFAAISPSPRHDVFRSDNHKNPLALRKEKAIRKERAVSVSEEPSFIPVSEDPSLISVSEEPSFIPVSEDPSLISVSEEPSFIPVSEDPSLISVPENMPARFTQSSQEEIEQRDLTVAPGLSVLTDQEHMHLSDAPSVQGIVQGGPLQPSDGGIAKRHSRSWLWLAVFLVALIIVGVIGWLLVLQLASNSNTNPWQRFNGTNLGFSVLYPTDWQVQVDSKQSIVHFYDSTQTDKVTIAVSSGATTSNVAPFLQQQASQLGMTNVTTEPSRSFAGTSWQQVQGKLSQEGVSYSVTMLATMHGKRLYLLTQIAPQSTYNDEETLVFSMMRAGLQFS
jgi:hypothetical protein